MLLIYLCLLVRKQTVHKHTKEKSLFNLNEKIDSMLPCVCSVIDHR